MTITLVKVEESSNSMEESNTHIDKTELKQKIEGEDSVDGKTEKNSGVTTLDSKCFAIIDIVLFKLDSYKVNNKTKSRIISKLSDLNKNTKIKLVGRTCDIGLNDYNDNLAKKRVEAVASILRENEFQKIDLEWEGKCCYLSENREINRRVEINKEVTK